MVTLNAGHSLLIRADANTQIGAGHFMRCLALAQGWQDRGGKVVFVTACENKGLRERLAQEGLEVTPVEQPHPDPADWETTSKALKEHSGAWTVLDGYHFDSSYQCRIKETGHPLLVIDDMAHLERYYADVILNQNLHASKLLYECESDTELLMGTRYALLRREFLQWPGRRREVGETAHKVLVTMGASDPDDVTSKVIHALDRVDQQRLEATVVVGASNPHGEAVRAAGGSSRHSVRLVRNTDDMPELMAWADFAISAAGSTCWELAFMGVPSVLLVLAENQRRVADGLAKVGAAVNLGPPNGYTEEQLAEELRTWLVDYGEVADKMTSRGRRLVDGLGTTRVVEMLQGCRIRLRPVVQEDCRLLWQWANDPVVRAAAFSSDPIPWESHVDWFDSHLRDPTCYMYIAETAKGCPIGQVRLDTEDGGAVIDVSLAPDYRGKGYSVSVIDRAVRRFFRDGGGREVHAYVKPENISSRRAFRGAGFLEVGVIQIGALNAVHYLLNRSSDRRERE